MTDRPNVTELLAAALQQAADVARSRLGRDVSVIDGAPGEASSLLRFDLSFGDAGRLSWFISNEDATGFSDMLIGGAGDRGAALTEMHLDALTAAMGDMLGKVVDGMSAGLSTSVEAGDLDLGMEETLPDVDLGGARVVRALMIDGFGAMPIIQHTDGTLAEFIDQHAALQPAGAAPAAPPAQAATPAPDPAALAAEAATAAAGAFADVPETDNVVPLPGSAASTGPARNPGDLEMLMNVPLPLTVELGQTQRTIRQLVDFTVGSIIELGKLAGDPLDIKVNDRVIARGEVVVIDEEFGIRITEIMSPEDRLRGLG